MIVIVIMDQNYYDHIVHEGMFTSIHQLHQYHIKNHWKHSQAMALHSEQLTIRACNLGGLKADDLKPLKKSSMVYQRVQLKYFVGIFR